MAATPAIAHDHEPPRTALRANGETVQRGQLGSYCWISRSSEPGTYVRACADVIPSYPSAAYVDPGTRVTLRIFKLDRPRQLSIWAWRRVDENGFPKGRATELRYTSRRVRLNDRVAWDFTFVVSNTPRHYYIDVFGQWQDEDRVGMQDASWMFHIRTSR